MSAVKEEIRTRIERLLQTGDETGLKRLAEGLDAIEVRQNEWEQTPEAEKQKIRIAFDSMKHKENRVSHKEAIAKLRGRIEKHSAGAK